MEVGEEQRRPLELFHEKIPVHEKVSTTKCFELRASNKITSSVVFAVVNLQPFLLVSCSSSLHLRKTQAAQTTRPFYVVPNNTTEHVKNKMPR